MDERSEQTRDAARTILVVEDDHLARTALHEIFELLGHTCLLAADGQEALAIYSRHAGEIGLVLSDFQMPNLDGIQLAQRLAALDPQVKVVLATGYASEDQRQALRDTRISGWIQKPYSLDQLATLVDNLLAR